MPLKKKKKKKKKIIIIMIIEMKKNTIATNTQLILFNRMNVNSSLETLVVSLTV